MFAIFCFVTTVWAQTADGWVGRYAFDKDSAGRTFFEIPPVKNALDKLTKEEREEVTTLNSVFIPITQIGHCLISRGCRPHECPRNYSVVIIDLRNGVVHFGIRRTKENHRENLWISTEGNYYDLPKDVQEAFQLYPTKK